MKVLILAAGYGTRLYPLVSNTPKPLLMVGQQPLVNHLLDKIRGISGLREVRVVTNDKFYTHFLDWAQANTGYPVPIKILSDGTKTPEERLGSVGDIHFSLENHPVDDDLLVIGGDNLFDYSLEEYITFARTRCPHVTIGLYDIGDLEAAKQFGVVAVDKEGKVVDFEEKPPRPKSSLAAMCFYHFPQESLGLVAEYLHQSGKSDKAGDYIRWLSEEKTVYGFQFQGRWYDVGSIESYQEVQKGW